MARQKFVRPELPPQDDPNYVDMLISACIRAFDKFGDDAMALNYMGVNGKVRPIVLENERYKTETRRIQAEKYLDEIEEIESISAELKTGTPDESSYDIRNPKDMDNYAKDIKENLTLRLKVADMRREILSVNKSKEAEENNALNVFFIALTAEEFAAMQNVEIHHGSDGAKFDEGSKSTIEKARQLHEEDDNMPDPFIIGADGSLEEIITP